MPVSRRTVTVLFCDVVDWTPLGAMLDPEVLRERQTHYHTEARGVLERHGGKWSASLRAVRYDFEAAAQQVLANGFPKWADAIRTGWAGPEGLF